MRLAPNGVETLRASAVFRRLQNDAVGARQLIERAKAMQGADPWTVVIESSLRPAPEGETLLRQTLEAAPDFAAARIKLARMLLDRGDVDRAKHELDLAIAKAPTHREANRLLAHAAGKKAKRDDEG
jgi:predicted Zn-dependent protease